MIKNYNPRPFEQNNPLPSYVVVSAAYTLVAWTKNGYAITLAKLTVGESVSAGNPLTHALFESFSDHGERMAVARTRVSGYERTFTAVKNAMMEAGVEFEPVAPCHCETMLTALGAWIQAGNPEIAQYELVSQTCH